MNKQILHRIDYNGGEIWVDKESPINVGDTYYTSLEHDLPWITVCKNIDKSKEYWLDNSLKYINFKEGIWGSYKVVSQSPNLSLPNIPYVEIEEDGLRSEFYDAMYEWEKKDGKQYDHLTKDELAILHEGFLQGYKAASAKGYTEKNLRRAYYEGVSFGATEGFAYNKAIPKIDDLLESLQPKVVSIEVETEISHTGDGTYSTRPEDMVVLEPIQVPVTYTRDGKTFLKVIKVNHDTAN